MLLKKNGLSRECVRGNDRVSKRRMRWAAIQDRKSIAIITRTSKALVAAMTNEERAPFIVHV